MSFLAGNKFQSESQSAIAIQTTNVIVYTSFIAQNTFLLTQREKEISLGIKDTTNNVSLLQYNHTWHKVQIVFVLFYIKRTY